MRRSWSRGGTELVMAPASRAMLATGRVFPLSRRSTLRGASPSQTCTQNLHCPLRGRSRCNCEQGLTEARRHRCRRRPSMPRSIDEDRHGSHGMDQAARLQALRSRAHQKRLQQNPDRRRRYNARRLSLAPVVLDVEAHRVRHHTDDHVY